VIDADADAALSVHAAAAEAPDRLAIVAPGARLTYAELARAVARLPAGDGPVELDAAPSLETLVAIAAALAADRPLVLHHPRLPAAQRAREAELAAALPLPPGTLAVIFTSGSTGAPRPIALGRREALGAAAASAAHLGWRDDDAWLCALPLAHVSGLAITIRCVAARRTIALATEGGAAGIRAAMIAGRATLASLVPTQLADLVAGPALPAHLRAVLLGGAAAPRALRAAAAERGVPFLTTYGMTETWGQVATAPLAAAGTVDDAAGVPLPGVELVAGTPGAAGVISVRGPMCRGTVTTADLGYLDARGWLRIVGRADDVIITGGENVHPLSVEDVLAATPGVVEACVVGLPDPRWGQRVVAAVVLAPGAVLARVAADAADRLAPHQRPRGWQALRALPRTASGKLDRRATAAAITAPVVL
jgi:O-succinylbenzoic acid--CoA ligase